MTDVGLYIHVPFCRKKCGYCDFCSIVADTDIMHRGVDALLGELDSGPAGIALRGRVRTIFVGGGTPTVLPPAELGRLLQAFKCANRLTDAGPEFTVEANPATLDPTRADLLREAGVSRISIGAQSFDQRELDTLDRSHHPDDVHRTVSIARQVGIKSINLDLIFGIPGQTLSTWASSLEQALALEVNHVSCYGLTYEQGTPLHRRLRRGEIQACDEESEAAMYEYAIDRLTAAGFEHYEVSNFARPGSRCEHNLRYWRNEPYVGIGPSAASYLAGERTQNVADVRQYIERIAAGRSPIATRERLDAKARAGEAAMLRLRLIEGIDRKQFEEKTGFDPMTLFVGAIERHAGDCRISVTDTHIRLTRAGLLIADAVMADFIDATRQGG